MANLAGRSLDSGAWWGFTVVGALALAGADTAMVMLRPTLWPSPPDASGRGRGQPGT